MLHVKIWTNLLEKKVFVFNHTFVLKMGHLGFLLINLCESPKLILIKATVNDYHNTSETQLFEVWIYIIHQASFCSNGG